MAPKRISKKALEVEDKRLHDYELILIISPEVADSDLNKVMDKVTDFAKKVGGNITEVTQWGRKKFTFPIRKFIEGNYVLAHLEIFGDLVHRNLAIAKPRVLMG